MAMSLKKRIEYLEARNDLLDQYLCDYVNITEKSHQDGWKVGEVTSLCEIRLYVATRNTEKGLKVVDEYIANAGRRFNQ